MNELKPCPFCGSEAILRVDSGYLFYIQCMNLACTARDTRWFKSEEEAIKAWNSRIGLPANSTELRTAPDSKGRCVCNIIGYNKYCPIHGNIE